MKYTFYNLPIQYEKLDRYYKTKGGSIVNNLPPFVIQIDTKNLNNNPKPTLKPTTLLTASLKFSKKPTFDFNYVVITSDEDILLNQKEVGYFVINQSQIIAKNRYLCELKVDIFMTFNLLKKTSDKIKVNIKRRHIDNYNLWHNNIDNTDYLTLYSDYMSEVWDNKEIINSKYYSYWGDNNTLLRNGKYSSSGYKTKKLEYGSHWGNGFYITQKYKYFINQVEKTKEVKKYINDTLLCFFMKEVVEREIKGHKDYVDLAYVSNAATNNYSIIPIVSSNKKEAYNPSIYEKYIGSHRDIIDRVFRKNEISSEKKPGHQYTTYKVSIDGSEYEYNHKWKEETLDQQAIDKHKEIEDAYKLAVKIWKKLRDHNNKLPVALQNNFQNQMAFFEIINKCDGVVKDVDEGKTGEIQLGDKTNTLPFEDLLEKYVDVFTINNGDFNTSLFKKFGLEYSNQNYVYTIDTLYDDWQIKEQTGIIKYFHNNELRMKVNDDLLDYDKKGWYSQPVLLNENYYKCGFNIFNNYLNFSNFTYFKNPYTLLLYKINEPNIVVSITNQDQSKSSTTAFDYDNFTLKKGLQVMTNLQLDTGAIAYYRKSNYYNAKQKEIETNAKIEQDYVNKRLVAERNKLTQMRDNNMEYINRMRNKTIDILQKQTNLNLTSQIFQGAAMIAGSTLLPGSSMLAAAGAAGYSALNINKSLAGANITTQDISETTALNQQKLLREVEINKQAMMKNAAITNERISKIANVQKNTLQAEIADLYLQPIINNNIISGEKLTNINKNNFSFFEMKLRDNVKEKIWQYYNKNGLLMNRLTDLKNEDWYDNYAHFNFLQGEEWDQYLDNINIKNPIIRSEFELLMSQGIRIWHNKYEPFKINYNLVNWREDIYKKIKGI